METNKLKAVLCQHFSQSPSLVDASSQYVDGDWFTPHHTDSLDDLLKSDDLRLLLRDEVALNESDEDKE